MGTGLDGASVQSCFPPLSKLKAYWTNLSQGRARSADCAFEARLLAALLCPSGGNAAGGSADFRSDRA